jgi:hypothetical protein
VFNAMIDRRPLAVLRCHDTADVVHGIAVRLNQNVVPARGRPAACRVGPDDQHESTTGRGPPRFGHGPVGYWWA